MRIADLLARLEPLPAAFPEGPPSLLPVLAEPGAAPARPPWDAVDPAARAAAVLVLIVPGRDGEAHVVLTERVDRGGHHAGEVSFPGGRSEPGDATAVATALREAGEEVGLAPDEAGVRVLGTVEPHWIPVSNHRVTPVVAVAARRPRLVARPAEVATIVEAPVRAFLPGAPLVAVERELRGRAIRYDAYPVGGLLVWGMTARILGGLGAWIARPTRTDGRGGDDAPAPGVPRAAS